MTDIPLHEAANQVANPGARPRVQAFFDGVTSTVTYVVHDPESLEAAVIDSVLDYDPASGRTQTVAADKVIKHVRDLGLRVTWLLETHAHADHISAAPYLREKLGGAVAIGEDISAVQEAFRPIFNMGCEAENAECGFDRLWRDGDHFAIGALPVTVLHVPGHTPACVAYVIADTVFVGDTMFMPDYGTARADFPGGDARVRTAEQYSATLAAG
ncbi:MBL fold metallo-hydrolase [Novosphingobium sp.]|uniref:MBL fold metallo-hydrolase n=1 Tax=Novosphingobium sp. TaxID=1874826 RepID=UPI003FA5A40C